MKIILGIITAVFFAILWKYISIYFGDDVGIYIGLASIFSCLIFTEE